MTKKQFHKVLWISIGIGLFVAAALFFAAFFEDSAPQTGTILGVTGLVGMFGLCIHLIANYKQLVLYEVQNSLKKNKDMALIPLIPISMELSEAHFSKLFEHRRHGKSGKNLYWVYKADPWLGNATYLIEFVNDLDMAQNDDANEDELELTEQEVELLNRQLPKGHQNGSHTRIVFNLCEAVDELKIAQASQIATNAEIVSRTLGYFGPVGLFFLFDRSTNTLYCEPYRRYRLYPRQRAIKRFYKMLGIFEQVNQ